MANDQVMSGSKASKKVVGLGKIKSVELCPFTQKMAAMLGAGLPILQCLEALIEQTQHEGFRGVLSELYAKIEAGENFSKALEMYPDVFSDLYISMVSAGEMSGSLAEILERLAAYLEAAADLKRKVKSAMMYPLIVIIVAIIITSILIVFVVPVFGEMFASFGEDLPMPTQILLNISGFIRGNIFIILGAMAVFVFAFRRVLKSEAGSMFIAKHSLHAPPFGVLITKIAMARVCRTFASLIESGLPILKAIDIVGQTSGNKYIAAGMSVVKDDIQAGLTLTDSMRATGLFPPMLLHMLGTGEKTGNVDAMLSKVADFYEKEVEATLEGLSSMIEPLLMVLVGSTIGSIAICMFLPIFEMGAVVSK